MRPPLVSVLILNYRNPTAAVQCVRLFLAQTVADQLEIIIVDNGSRDDSVGVLRNTFAGNDQVRIVETPFNGGFGYGYNTAARYATGQYLLINNPDKSMPPDGVEQLVERFSANDQVGIIAPKLVHPDGTYRTSMRSFPRLLDIVGRRSFVGKIFPGHVRQYLMQDADPEQEHEVDWVVGGCFMLRRELFEQLAGFDERFFLFFEDTDLCRRCRALGKSILYYPTVAAGDKKRRLSGASFFDLMLTKIGRIHLISALKYFWKWGWVKSEVRSSKSEAFSDFGF